MYGRDLKISFNKLNETDTDIATFDCGNNSINGFFQNNSLTDDESVTYIFRDITHNKIIACVTISCSGVFEEKENQYTNAPAESYKTLLPAVEIKYFALDSDYQHMRYIPEETLTLGHYILAFLIKQIEYITKNVIGASKIILYAVPSAKSFYKKCRFQEFLASWQGDEDPYLDGCIPMYYNL